MGFVLSPEDFIAFGAQRDDANARRKRINVERRAGLAERQGIRKPFIPTGQGAGLAVNQVGPTAAEQQAAAAQAAQAQKVAAEKAAAEKAAADAAVKPGLTTADIVQPSRVGQGRVPGIQQVDPEGSRVGRFFDQGTADRQFQERMNRVERALLEDTSGFSSIKTGLFGRKPERAALAERGAALDFFRQNKAFFRANPQLLAELEADPRGFIKSQIAGQPAAVKAGVPLTVQNDALAEFAAKTETDPKIKAELTAGLTAPAAPTAAVPVTRTIIANNKKNPVQAKDRPIPTKGASVAKQLATKAPAKVKEAPFNMPFNLRAQEINTLLATRESLKRTAFITGGSPASEAFIQARADLDMNRVAIENLTQTQALNLMQLNNDPRMLNQLLNRRFPRRNVRISPNSDGTFRVEADGKIIGARVNKTKLITSMRRTNSTVYHQGLKNAKTEQIAKRDAALLKTQETVLGKRWDLLNTIEKANAEKNGKFFKGDDGNIWTNIGGRPTLLVIGEEESKVSGEDVTTVTQVPVNTVTKTDPAGLTTATASGVSPTLSSFFASFK